MPPIPRDKSLDSMLALLSDGYTLISKRCHRHQLDIFETRLMLRKVVCATGEEAAKMFYCPDVIANTHTRSTVNFR
jgi:fatty-acid peroxygenase